MNLLDLVFPKRCVNCGRIGKYICASCAQMIRFIRSNEYICSMCGRSTLDGVTHPKCRTDYSIDRLTSFFHYNGVVQKTIKAIKYRLVSDLAEEFVGLTSAPTFRRGDNVLVPIPLHPTRFRQRGFNQAEILGKFVAKKLNIPMRTDILRRARATPAQAEIKIKKDRVKNMKDSFISIPVSGSVILFDDVCTTGATLQNAARALKMSGATHIWAITMAR